MICGAYAARCSPNWPPSTKDAESTPPPSRFSGAWWQKTQPMRKQTRP